MEIKKYGNIGKEFWNNSLELFEILEKSYDLRDKTLAVCEKITDIAIACAEMITIKAVSVIEREKIQMEEPIQIFNGDIKPSYFGEAYGLIYTCEEIAKMEYRFGKTWSDLRHLCLSAARRNLPKKDGIRAYIS